MAEYIAFSYPDGNSVSLLVSVGSKLKDGRFSGHVINGAWNGKFSDTDVYVNYTGQSFPGRIVWRGEWPIASSDYNAAIEFIESQLTPIGRVKWRWKQASGWVRKKLMAPRMWPLYFGEWLVSLYEPKRRPKSRWDLADDEIAF
jgi:hypothetical protein